MSEQFYVKQPSLVKIQFQCQKQLQLYVTIQLSVNTILMSKKQFYFKQFS